MWLARQVEGAGLVPRLGHPLKIKRRITGSTRTDETDSAGLLILLSNGTFPEVWMAPSMLGGICVASCEPSWRFAGRRAR
jgi:hypothetical protein